MALITWLSRITPLPSNNDKENGYEAKVSGNWKRPSNPSKDMYALQSDPFTHFSLVFAALVHDLEHPGVPNAQVRRAMFFTGVRRYLETLLVGGATMIECHSICLVFRLLPRTLTS
jgi:hypothetical protein